MVVIHSLYREGGVVTVDRDTCKKCHQCVNTCPAGVLDLRGDEVHVNEETPFGCIACGHCMMVCPGGSIRVTGRGISPDDLLDLPKREDRATADALAALLLARRSVRRFKKEEVGRKVLDRVVEMASSAPMGIPPWDVGVVVVHGRERVQKLAGEIIRGYEGFLRIFRPWVLALLRPLMRRSTHEGFKSFLRPLAGMLVASRRMGRDDLFWDAPAVLIFHQSEYAEPADSIIPCTYAMLAAESLGLGTTMIGSAAPILQRNPALLREYGIPRGNRPALVLILGHPAVPFQRAVRRHFTSVRFISDS